MSEKQSEIIPTETWMPKALIIGGVVGAAVGVTATYLLLQRHQAEQGKSFSMGEGVKIGVLVFSLLRSIANL